jgi:uncharacterized membrane protein YdjX (TVP38/TMEM64 family)
MTKKLIVLAVLLLGAGVFVATGAGEYFTLGYLKAAHADVVAYTRANPGLASLGFFLLYVVVTALSLPGAAVMTVAAGAVFGLLWGLALVSFASTLGATAAMLISRTLLQEWVQRRFAGPLNAINRGFEADGAFYLFSVRMVPLFPFFIINLVMGLTRISLWQFYWVSQLGMFAGTVVFVFAGTQLATIESLSDVLSPGLIIALSLLGLFPLLARKTLGWIRSARTDGAAS